MAAKAGILKVAEARASRAFFGGTGQIAVRFPTRCIRSEIASHQRSPDGSSSATKPLERRWVKPDENLAEEEAVRCIKGAESS